MKIGVRVNNRSHRYDINGTRLRHSYNYTKYKICLSMMMVMCNKQHLSHIWSWIYEKVQAELKKSVAYIKKRACLKIHWEN